MHVIAAKAECFHEALQPEFQDYMNQVVKNIKAMAVSLEEEGFKIISGGTDNHLILVDVKNSANITGKEAQELLDKIHITVNKNSIPNDHERPMVTSGIRIGSPAMTTRGLKENEFIQIGKILAKALKNPANEKLLDELSKEVIELTSKFPLKYEKE